MSPGSEAIDQAAKRLERAVALLEQRLAKKMAEAGAVAGGASDADRVQMAEALDAAKSREKALEAAVAEASHALSQAIAEIRTALGQGA